jgi:hypothetical protein
MERHAGAEYRLLLDITIFFCPKDIHIMWLIIGAVIVLVILLAAIYEYSNIQPASASTPTPVAPSVPAYTPPTLPSIPLGPSPSSPAASSPGTPYLWDPTTNGTANASQALIAGQVGSMTIYVAAAPTSSGQLVLGKSDGTTIWYNDGGEKSIPVSQGYLLPASAVPTASWGSTLANGVALASNPSAFVCRAQMANGVHAGYTSGNNCNITYAGTLKPQTSFDYLNY